MYNKYNDQSSEYTDSIYENPGYDNNSMMYSYPDRGEPRFEEYPPMHGTPHHGGHEFGNHPPMHGGPHHGPHHDEEAFDSRPPMHGGPHFGPRPGEAEFGGRPPMHGAPHCDPGPDDPGFYGQPPVPGDPESFGSFRELPFDIPGQYETLPVGGKLMHNFRLLSHQIHATREGAAGQRRILTILSAVPAVSQRQLMTLLGVRAGTLSEVIGKLEAAGKIRRVPNPNDRRMMMVSITPKGMASVSENKETSSNLFDTLNDSEKQTLLSLLEKILAGKTPPADISDKTYEC